MHLQGCGHKVAGRDLSRPAWTLSKANIGGFPRRCHSEDYALSKCAGSLPKATTRGASPRRHQRGFRPRQSNVCRVHTLRRLYLQREPIGQAKAYYCHIRLRPHVVVDDEVDLRNVYSKGIVALAWARPRLVATLSQASPSRLSRARRIFSIVPGMSTLGQRLTRQRVIELVELSAELAMS